MIGNLSQAAFLAIGLALPFAGTALGSACVWFMRGPQPEWLRKSMSGFAAGVMVAAAVWSLLIPSMEMGGGGWRSVLPAAGGFLIGVAFLLLLDRLTPHRHAYEHADEGPKARGLSRTAKLALAITLHNIPEGLAVGITLAGALEESAFITLAGALALSLGIAAQNFPEGAIVSMPLRAEGNSRGRSFAIGVLSGAVEPIAAALAIWVSVLVLPLFAWMLAFGAGAMIYVVVEELIPESAEGGHSNVGTIGFAVGFTAMMMLDTLLG